MDHYLLGNQDNPGFIKERSCLKDTFPSLANLFEFNHAAEDPILAPTVSGPPTSLGRGSISKSEILIQSPNYLRPQLGALKACFTMCLCITVSSPGIFSKEEPLKRTGFSTGSFMFFVRNQTGTGHKR